MVDNHKNKVEVGDSVRHRHINSYSIGIIEKIEGGCNAICWVNFGQIILNKKHLTICSKSDIVKIIEK